MPNPITPTNGRIVWCRHLNGQLYAAMITNVHNDECVDLHVFLPSQEAPVMYVTSVKYDGTGEMPGTWLWMPYQLGQAARTEAAEKKLAE